MSKELEALENIKEHLPTIYPELYGFDNVSGCFGPTKECQNELNIIETALKNLWLYKEDYERVMKEKNSLLKEYAKNQKKLKALEIIKVLFKDRARLYTRNDGIEQTIDKNGNYHKTNCVVYILDFYVGSVHYEFHLDKEEYDLLKEVLK